MNEVRTRTVVCCYRGKVGTDLSVLCVFFFLIDRVKFTDKEYR
jgi:hypothetical protein